MTFFINFANDSRIGQRVGFETPDILVKGVIEILSSNIELGGLNSYEGKVCNSTALVADVLSRMTVHIANRCGAIVLSVGKVRQDLKKR